MAKMGFFYMKNRKRYGFNVELISGELEELAYGFLCQAEYNLPEFCERLNLSLQEKAELAGNVYYFNRMSKKTKL